MDAITTVDYHTGGEPFRIVVGGVPPIPGATVLERREAARAAPWDVARRLLCHEPRGHADMYGCFLVPPDDEGADLACLFWHKDGYSTACGHGTIALATWAVEHALVAAPDDGTVDLAIDVPSGRVRARVARCAGAVTSVAFRSVPAWVVARALPVATARGEVGVDVAWGGAIYATVRAADLGLAATAEHYQTLIDVGREIKRRLSDHDVARHPGDDRLSGIYGTIFWDDLGDGADGPHQRNVTVFADGEVDRSPCGSGTAARVALLSADGRLDGQRVLRHDSLVGSTFRARIVGRVTVDGRDAVVPEVEGRAFMTGEHRFVLDPRDDLGTGFVLR